ncbi:uncharacterized protein N7482_006606 [Penicillium canariense]|uniref:Uncharacterized protein n=1 Tax=Penicillium canariense TaxID=189055 RepID=A0A9W9LIB5_9EURO|nr:uncharacterized protein N7482_006606 [Penicillium canariense]KAJ5159602.1 hypothetical protein N7482_006606 [Penicillium canariense]
MGDNVRRAGRAMLPGGTLVLKYLWMYIVLHLFRSHDLSRPTGLGNIVMGEKKNIGWSRHKYASD